MYLGRALTLSVTVVVVWLLMVGLGHQRITLVGLRNRVLVLEDDGDASGFGFECLV